MLQKLREIFSKKKNVEIATLIIGLSALTVLLVTKFWHPAPPARPYDTGGPNITSAFDAHAAAEKVAREWHGDAVLSTLASNRAAPGGEISEWRFIFVSPSNRGKGFIVNVDTAKVLSTEEVNYSGTAAQFSPDIISQGEAIRRVHQIRGYENAEILGIEAVYDKSRGTWFWAAKTSRGTVSIDAKQ